MAGDVEARAALFSSWFLACGSCPVPFPSGCASSLPRLPLGSPHTVTPSHLPRPPLAAPFSLSLCSLQPLALPQCSETPLEASVHPSRGAMRSMGLLAAGEAALLAGEPAWKNPVADFLEPCKPFLPSLPRLFP